MGWWPSCVHLHVVIVLSRLFDTTLQRRKCFVLLAAKHHLPNSSLIFPPPPPRPRHSFAWLSMFEPKTMLCVHRWNQNAVLVLTNMKQKQTKRRTDTDCPLSGNSQMKRLRSQNYRNFPKKVGSKMTTKWLMNRRNEFFEKICTSLLTPTTILKR